MKDLAESILNTYYSTKQIYIEYIGKIEQAYLEMSMLMVIATLLALILLITNVILIRQHRIFKKAIKKEIFKFLQK